MSMSEYEWVWVSTSEYEWGWVSTSEDKSEWNLKGLYWPKNIPKQSKIDVKYKNWQEWVWVSMSEYEWVQVRMNGNGNLKGLI